MKENLPHLVLAHACLLLILAFSTIFQCRKWRESQQTLQVASLFVLRTRHRRQLCLTWLFRLKRFLLFQLKGKLDALPFDLHLRLLLTKVCVVVFYHSLPLSLLLQFKIV